MKRFLFSLMFAFVFGGSALCQEPDRGIGPGIGRGIGTGKLPTYTINDEEFAAEFPSRPAYSTSTVSGKDGKKRTKHILSLSKDGVDYRTEVFENGGPVQSLEEFITESKLSDAANARNLTVDGIAGKEYSSHTSKGIKVTQVFVTQDRVFRFTVTGPVSSSADIKKFFSSIELGQEASGTDVVSDPYTGKEVDVKARPIMKPEPSYTDNARNNKVEGTVVLRVVFAKNGKVENIRVISGLPDGLTGQAIEAARQIKFIPAQKDGKPVSMWIQLEHNFRL